MILSWGKPTITISPISGTGAVLAEGNSGVLPDAVEGSTQLNTTKGDKTEATVEGGEVEAVRYTKNKYSLTLTIRNGQGSKLPFAVDDGHVDGEWKVVLKPEAPEAPGFTLNKAQASVEDSWTAADGGTWILTFDAVKPAQGEKQIEWDLPSA